MADSLYEVRLEWWWVYAPAYVDEAADLVPRPYDLTEVGEELIENAESLYESNRTAFWRVWGPLFLLVGETPDRTSADPDYVMETEWVLAEAEELDPEAVARAFYRLPWVKKANAK